METDSDARLAAWEHLQAEYPGAAFDLTTTTDGLWKMRVSVSLLAQTVYGKTWQEAIERTRYLLSDARRILVRSGPVVVRTKGGE